MFSSTISLLDPTPLTLGKVGSVSQSQNRKLIILLHNLIALYIHHCLIYCRSVGFPMGRDNSYYNQDFTISLDRATGDDDSVMACDIGTISIIDTGTRETLTSINIPASAFVSSHGKCVMI